MSTTTDLRGRHLMKLADFSPEELTLPARPRGRAQGSEEGGTRGAETRRQGDRADLREGLDQDALRVRGGGVRPGRPRDLHRPVRLAHGPQGDGEGHGPRARPHVRRNRVPRLRAGHRRGARALGGCTGLQRPDRRVAPHADPRRLPHVPRARRRSRSPRSSSATSATRDSTWPTRYLIGGAKLGMDVRIASPKSLWPRDEIVELARSAAAETGATITITDDVGEAVKGADFLLTDVWVSMGEADDVWAERIELLKPVPGELRDDGERPATRTSSSCTACRRSTTRRPQVGKEIYEKFGMDVARGDRGGVRVAGVDRVRRGREPDAHDQGRDGRDARQLMRVVVALGGNALLRRGEPLTAENQRANAQAACAALAPVALEHELVISHGNGPQVGLLALRARRTRRSRPTRSTSWALRPRG